MRPLSPAQREALGPIFNPDLTYIVDEVLWNDDEGYPAATYYERLVGRDHRWRVILGEDDYDYVCLPEVEEKLEKLWKLQCICPTCTLSRCVVYRFEELRESLSNQVLLVERARDLAVIANQLVQAGPCSRSRA